MGGREKERDLYKRHHERINQELLGKNKEVAAKLEQLDSLANS